MSRVRVVTTPLECGALARGALAGAPPSPWYARPPVGVEQWRARGNAIAAGAGDWLDALRPAFGGGAALLDRVARGQGVVVTTGQQPGLFGGPWYTWFKGIAALEMARALETATGVPAAPVFWAATDDADFAEAATTVIAEQGTAARLTLRATAADGVPMSHVRLGDDVDALLDRLRLSVGPAADPTLLRAAAAWAPGATVGDAYVAMLRAVLEPLGVAVLDVSHPAVGDAARPMLERAFTSARAVHEALTAQAAAIAGAGLTAPVDVERPLSTVFAWESTRDSVPIKRRLTLDEARGPVRSERLSANVLLRPVLERRLVPTVAYLAGPGELAYFSQAAVVADAMDVERPLGLPRWSGMLVPSEVDDVLARFSLTSESLRDPHAAERDVARNHLSPRAKAALVALRDAVESNVRTIDGELPPAVLEGSRIQLARRIDRLERRLLAAVKHREQGAMREVAAARATLFPFGKPQERALNAVPFWSRYGDTLVAAVRVACAEHALSLVRGTYGNG